MLFKNYCLRKLDDCSPFSNIVSDCNETFVCCGLSGEGSRTVNKDKFRFCFVSVYTDTVYDYDETDLKDQIAVMADALAISHRLKKG